MIDFVYCISSNSNIFPSICFFVDSSLYWATVKYDDGVQQIDHSVLAVGYDTSAKDPYYIVKNSWSEGWGENGYVRMKIGENIDCIACKAFYPKAGPTPPKPQPEIKCAAGTYDPSSTPTSCPTGSTCCCGKKKFWKPKQCAETRCCLSNQKCTDGKGCQ